MPVKYDNKTIEKAASLRERGLSYGQIAARLGMSIGAVEYHCLRRGADLPVPPAPAPYAGPMEVRRGNYTVKRFTAAEDARLIEMDISGMSVMDIARALGRPHNSIIGRLMLLARNEARKELRDCRKHTA